MWLECSIGNDILAVFLTFVVLLNLKMVLIMRKDVGRNDKHFEENVSHFSFKGKKEGIHNGKTNNQSAENLQE